MERFAEAFLEFLPGSDDGEAKGERAKGDACCIVISYYVRSAEFAPQPSSGGGPTPRAL